MRLQRHLTIEMLEGRRLLAGDVAAAGHAAVVGLLPEELPAEIVTAPVEVVDSGGLLQAETAPTIVAAAALAKEPAIQSTAAPITDAGATTELVSKLPNTDVVERERELVMRRDEGGQLVSLQFEAQLEVTPPMAERVSENPADPRGAEVEFGNAQNDLSSASIEGALRTGRGSISITWNGHIDANSANLPP